MNKKILTRTLTGLAALATAVIIYVGAGKNHIVSEDTILRGQFGVVTISVDGTEADPLDVICEGAIIKQIKVEGDYVHVTGCEVTGASSHGIYVTGRHAWIEGNEVHGTVTENGVGICKGTGGWGSAIKIGLGGDYAVVKGNHVYENCGEGIAATRARYVTIEDNAVGDNFSVGIYVDNSPYAIVENNRVLCAGGYLQDGKRMSGIAIGEESYSGWGAQMHDITVMDNAVSGCDIGIVLFPSEAGGTAKNILIADNSIPSGVRRSISIQSKNEAVRVENNEVFNAVYAASPSGVTLENNLIPAQQVTYHVSPAGSGNACTQSAPCGINTALGLAEQGDTLEFAAGTYSQQIAVSGDGVIFSGNGANVKTITISGNNNVVDGFVISDAASNYGIRTMPESSGNIISDNDISNTAQDGIWFFGTGNQFIGNNIHDIVDRSKISTDPHVDCFQTWGPAEDILFEQNTCDHTSTYGSNQIVMVTSNNPPVKGLTFLDNTFIMHDAGYSPLLISHKEGQEAIENIVIVLNTFHNTTGNGNYAISLKDVAGATVYGNVVTGYETELNIVGGSGIMLGTQTPTPTATRTPAPIWTLTPTLTQTPVTPTDAYECILFVEHDQVVCLP